MLWVAAMYFVVAILTMADMVSLVVSSCKEMNLHVMRRK